MTLPTDSAMRKNMPMTTGVIDYFPDALAAVARLSKLGNDKHNPGEPLHWAKEKSSDEPDCIARHLAERGTIDTDDGVNHSVKLAWRGLANLQRFIDANGIEACFSEEVIAEVAERQRIKADFLKDMPPGTTCEVGEVVPLDEAFGKGKLLSVKVRK